MPLARDMSGGITGPPLMLTTGTLMFGAYSRSQNGKEASQMDRHIKIMIIAPLTIIAGISVLSSLGKSDTTESARAADEDTDVENDAALEAPPILEAQERKAPRATILQRAILDAFPEMAPSNKADQTKARQAADYIAATINSAGHLCDRPIEAQKADENHYGIACRTRRSDNQRSNYLVNVRSGSVDAI